jgi:nickel-dependent lactate racemase
MSSRDRTSGQRNVAIIRFGAWNDARDLELVFPGSWQVTACPPRDAPDIGDDGIAAAFAKPIGTRRLSELASGRHRACIVIDDLSRPTPGCRLVPPILEELKRAGLASPEIRIIAGVANHRPMTKGDLIKKLGPSVFASCSTENHVSHAACVPIGHTRFGSPVEINARVMSADLKILVGSIIPHGAAGFSGGSKLLMPGVSSIASAEAYHRGSCTRGRYAVVETDARLETDDAARLAGIDFIVNSVPNSTLGLAGVFTGDVVAAHRAGTELAAQVFATPTPIDQDVCVLSAFPKDNEFLQYLTAFAPWQTAPQPIVREAGTVVVALEAREGLGSHALFGPGMPLDAKRPPRVRERDIVFFAPGLEKRDLPAIIRDETRLFRTWEETMAWLEAKHGRSARVAVFPCATMQLAANGMADSTC